jgi:hypothetical protein
MFAPFEHGAAFNFTDRCGSGEDVPLYVVGASVRDKEERKLVLAQETLLLEVHSPEVSLAFPNEPWKFNCCILLCMGIHACCLRPNCACGVLMVQATVDR